MTLVIVETLIRMIGNGVMHAVSCKFVASGDVYIQNIVICYLCLTLMQSHIFGPNLIKFCILKEPVTRKARQPGHFNGSSNKKCH